MKVRETVQTHYSKCFLYETGEGYWKIRLKKTNCQDDFENSNNS